MLENDLTSSNLQFPNDSLNGTPDVLGFFFLEKSVSDSSSCVHFRDTKFNATVAANLSNFLFWF